MSATTKTLRDEFAMAAMPTILKRWIDDAVADRQWSELTDPDNDGAPSDLAELAAKECWAMADAMLATRGAD